MRKPCFKAVIRRSLDFFCPKVVEYISHARGAHAQAQAEAKFWKPRIAEVLACPDNARLPRHPEAGKTRDGFQTMFNGIKVAVDGYYGSGMTELLRRNKGSHEPQEEVVFLDVLQRMPAGAQMIECGAYWGFYSMWFTREVPQGKAWLIEPEGPNLEIGQRNFRANRLEGDFHRALVGKESTTGNPPQVCIDDFCTRQKIGHLAILHADIQGAEVEMLHGATLTLSESRVDYVFISTHGEELHAQCVLLLQNFGYEVPVSVPPSASHSFDGLIVSHRAGLLKIPLTTPVAKKSIPDLKA